MISKVNGCGGRYSMAVFFPCSFCGAKNDNELCEHILAKGKTTKHKEWYSGMSGRTWSIKNANKNNVD